MLAAFSETVDTPAGKLVILVSYLKHFNCWQSMLRFKDGMCLIITDSFHNSQEEAMAQIDRLRQRCAKATKFWV